MAISYQTYTGNGSVTTFPISFDWIYASDVVVTVDGFTRVNGTDYTIVNKNVVFTTAPSTGTVVKVSRSSNLTARNVDFVNGSRLDESDLDNSAKQLFYLIQEIKDQTDDLDGKITAAAAALIIPNSVGNTALQSDSVTTSKVANDAITNSKVANGAITPAKLSTGGPSWDTSGNVITNGDNPQVMAMPNANGIGFFLSSAKNALGAIVGQLQMYSSAGAAIIAQLYNLPMLFFTNNAERMRISADGNVGIGTSSPTARLDVAGTIRSTSPAFSAFQTAGAGHALTANTWTKLNLASEEFDTDNCFNVTLSRFLPTVAGWYQINGTVGTTTSVSLQVALYKNGASNKLGGYGTAFSQEVSSLIYLNGTTDFVELFAFSATAATSNAGTLNTYLNGVLVKAA